MRKDGLELAGIFDKAIAALTAEEHDAVQRRWVAVMFEHGFDHGLFWRIMVVIGVADRGLYAAKDAGRNCVVTEETAPV